MAVESGQGAVDVAVGADVVGRRAAADERIHRRHVAFFDEVIEAGQRSDAERLSVLARAASC